jgi:transcriptional regulator with XRE-family HTH domain
MALTSEQLATLRAGAVPVTGNRLQLAAEMVGMTQAKVAEMAGVTQPYVSAVMRGLHQTITVENARKFADVFGCQIEDLFPAKSEVA